EHADEQRLLDQAGEDLVVGAQAPEESRERHVDHDQRGRDKRDFAAKQPEAAVDVAGEDLEEMVDDAGAAHDATRRSARRPRGVRHRWTRMIPMCSATATYPESGSGDGFRPRRAGMPGH